jgi:phage terminase small subunit
MAKKKRQKREFREELFVAEYLVDLNGTEALKRAGMNGSRATLATTAYRLLRKPEIAAAVRDGMEKRAARVELHQDEVLQVLLDHLRADMAEAFGDDGELLELHEMPPHVRRNIQSIEVEELYVKLWSKDKALELALRHKGLLNDKLKVQAELGLEQLIKAALNGEGKPQ